jgi:hypothetical protein
MDCMAPKDGAVGSLPYVSGEQPEQGGKAKKPEEEAVPLHSGGGRHGCA